VPWEETAALVGLIALLVAVGFVVFFIVAVRRGVRRGHEAERRHEM
jgi:hypothetical protein